MKDGAWQLARSCKEVLLSKQRDSIKNLLLGLITSFLQRIQRLRKNWVIKSKRCLYYFPRAAVMWWLKPHTQKTKNKNNCCLTVLSARSPKSRCQQSCALCEDSKGWSFLASSSFWWLLALHGLWQHSFNLCLYLYMDFFLVCIFVSFPLFIKPLVIAFRACPKSRMITSLDP